MRQIKFISSRKSQQGVAAVEFALIAVILFTLLFGIMEMGRILFMMNTTAEATRLGARLAVVCSQGADAITRKPAELASFLSGKIKVAYLPDGCTADNCRYVTVSVDPIPVQSIVPLIPVNFPMPPFSTTLPRESMSSLNNPICS